MRQSDSTPLAQRGSSNSGTPVSLRYGLFFASHREWHRGPSTQRARLSKGHGAQMNKAMEAPPAAEGGRRQHLSAPPSRASRPDFERDGGPRVGCHDDVVVHALICPTEQTLVVGEPRKLSSAPLGEHGDIDRCVETGRPGRQCAAERCPSSLVSEDIGKHPAFWPMEPGDIAPAAALQVPLRWNTWSSHFFLKVQL